MLYFPNQQLNIGTISKSHNCTVYVQLSTNTFMGSRPIQMAIQQTLVMWPVTASFFLPALHELLSETQEECGDHATDGESIRYH